MLLVFIYAYILMVILRLAFCAGFLILFLNAFTQKSLDDIDLYRIPQKKVRQLIVHQKKNKIHRFEDLRGSFKSNEDTTAYRTVNKFYLIKENLSNVWENYLSTDLTRAWNGNIVSFGVSVSKTNENICYGNDLIVNADTGQVLYLNLRLLKGVYNLAVAFEITKIDPIRKIIIFNYIEGGKSRGEQILRFRSTSEGFTEIEHKTFFKSNSGFRDKRLYPFFHLKAIDEFHANIYKARLEKAHKAIPEVGSGQGGEE